MNEPDEFQPMDHRFRGFLPVVVDVETGGFNYQTDALLQIAAVILRMDSKGDLYRYRTVTYHVEPFEGANMEPKSLEVNGIDPFHPLRLAVLLGGEELMDVVDDELLHIRIEPL